MALWLCLVYLLGIVSTCVAEEIVEGEKVTNEATITFNIENYQGSDEERNVTVEIALFGDVAPMTVMNFLGLCRGYSKRGKLLHYVGTPVHRIIPDFVIQMGDVSNRDGTGGHSIYGPVYDDEDFHLSHVSKGIMGMANTGKNSNGSQFYITLVKARWLDNSHVVFGKVTRGMDIVDEIGEIPASRHSAKPTQRIFISECTELNLEKKWIMSEDQLFSNADIKY